MPRRVFVVLPSALATAGHVHAQKITGTTPRSDFNSGILVRAALVVGPEADDDSLMCIWDRTRNLTLRGTVHLDLHGDR
jgi:hypothetical protein